MIGKYLGKTLKAIRTVGSVAYAAGSKINQATCKTLEYVAEAYQDQADARKYDAIVAEAKAQGMTPELFAMTKYAEQVQEVKGKFKDIFNRRGKGRTVEERMDDAQHARTPEEFFRALRGEVIDIGGSRA